MKKLTIQSIFDEDPEGGFPLRGDPYLWNILRARMHGWVDPSIASPDTKIEDVHDELDKIVMDMYKKTTGKKLEGEGGDLCKFIQTRDKIIAARLPSMLLNFLRLNKSKVVVPKITRATEELEFRMRHWFAVRQLQFD